MNVFADFKFPLEFEGVTFDQLLDDEDEREALISQLATLAEVHFLYAVIPRAERQLVGDEESIQSLIDALLYTSEAHY